MTFRLLQARHHKTRTLLILAIGYGLLAYLILPDLWARYERRHALAELPFITRNADGIPGDPINIGLIGTKADVIRNLHDVGWSPANAITLRSSIGIVESVLLNRADPDAPVSNLFYDNRREDLAFEKASGISADSRHHVRFWNVYQTAGEERAIWLGSASFDEGVGFSHYTGAVTHRIAPNVDLERDGLVKDFIKLGLASAVYRLTVEPAGTESRNAEGDRYVTDGRVAVVQFGQAAAPGKPPEEIAIPSLAALDDVLEGDPVPAQ
ncbi:LssY C-terminal domain-containing protein [Flaviflagellibacter deserti]|uniref:LssY C-terminal domain-containing protein n=1 Tax=Flaviflagellibacter deserti TaxID=2267266 RepID=A0ABV9YXI2_9HYPH